MTAPGPDARVLVVAPHPDDETLCCAGLLQQAIANGAQVAVVWITNGDGFDVDAMLVEHTLLPRGAPLRQLGQQRVAEARAAATLLGVPPARQYFLGYPDGNIARLLDSRHYTRPLRSQYTHLSTVAYAGAWQPLARYTGADLAQDLGQVLDDFQPTLVLAAAPQDRNTDHAASGRLVRELLTQRGEADRLRYWVVHAGPFWPRPRGLHPQQSLLPPADARALDWELLPLTPAQRTLKLAALRQHRSQMLVMPAFLLAFVRADELFAAP